MNRYNSLYWNNVVKSEEYRGVIMRVEINELAKWVKITFKRPDGVDYYARQLDVKNIDSSLAWEIDLARKCIDNCLSKK